MLEFSEAIQNELDMLRRQSAGLQANLKAACRSEIAARQSAALWKRAAKKWYRESNKFEALLDEAIEVHNSEYDMRHR